MDTPYDEDCVFCRIIRGGLPSFKLHEDDDVCCFLDIKPVTPGHLLVVPKYHAALTTELPARYMAALFTIGQRMNARVRERLGCAGVHYILQDGAAAGQEVPHVHLHVIPRNPGDGFGLKFPPHYNNPPTQDALREIFHNMTAAAGR